MAHLERGTCGPKIPLSPSLLKNDHALTGLGYAKAAFDFAALGNAAEKAGSAKNKDEISALLMAHGWHHRDIAGGL